MDRVPRQLSLSQQESLSALSRQVMAQLELHRQTRELVDRDAQLFKVLRSCPVALTIHRLSDGTVVDVNSVFSGVVGWTREDRYRSHRRGFAHRGKETAAQLRLASRPSARCMIRRQRSGPAVAKSAKSF